LFHDLPAAATAHQTAVGGNTIDCETMMWNCYTEYCKSIGLGNNLSLKEMFQTHKIKILRGFTVAVHQGQLS
jgi:hypothetical protein